MTRIEKTGEGKAEQTKRRIMETALDLFLKEGYERATMRGIAKKAKMSPGAAYYYFPSKEHIVYHYYEESYRKQITMILEVLGRETDFQKRLAGALKAHLEVAKPYHPISRTLFKTASDPSHPISPFSPESKELRNRNVDILSQLFEGSTISTSGMPKKFREGLPELLWLYMMGIILYWIYDDSPKQKKTFQLIDVSSALIAKIIGLTKLPGVKSIANKMIDLLHEFKPYN